MDHVDSQEDSADELTFEHFVRPAVLRDVAADVGRRLGTRELRVAVSSLQYHLAEDLWAVMLTAWVLDGRTPDAGLLRIRRMPEGRLRVRLARAGSPATRNATPEQAADAISDAVICRLGALHDGLRSLTKLAPAVLWGNAASGLVFSAQAVRAQTQRREVLAVAESILAAGPLTGHVSGDIAGPTTRRTCCLFYRTKAQRTCGGCPLG